MPMYKKSPCHVLLDLQAVRDDYILAVYGWMSKQHIVSSSTIQPCGSESLEWTLSRDSCVIMIPTDV